MATKLKVETWRVRCRDCRESDKIVTSLFVYVIKKNSNFLDFWKKFPLCFFRSVSFSTELAMIDIFCKNK